MTKTSETQTGHIMMDGTRSVKSYLVLARRGDILLGVQPGGFTRSEFEGLAVYMTRLRSAEGAGKLFAKEDKVSSIVNLSDSKVTAEDAWAFPFEKHRGHYASGFLNYWFEGKVTREGEDVIAAVNNGLARSLAAAIMVQVPEEYRVISQDDLSAWFQEKFDASVKEMTRALAYKSAAADVVKQYVGKTTPSADIHAALKALHAEHYPEHHQAKAEDLDTNEDSDEDDGTED